MTIKKRILAALLSAALLPLLLVAAMSFFYARIHLESQALSHMASTATITAEGIENMAREWIADIQAAQEYYNIKTNLPKCVEWSGVPTDPRYIAARTTLDAQLRALQTIKGYHNIILLAPSGKIVYASDASSAVEQGMEFRDPSGRSISELRQRVGFGSVTHNHRERGSCIYLTAPVASPSGGILGVIVFDIPLDPLFDMTAHWRRESRTGEVVLAERDRMGGQFISPLRFDPDAITTREIVFGSTDAIPMQKALLGENGQGRSVDYRGVEVLAAWRSISIIPWGFVVKIDAGEAFAPVAGLAAPLAFLAGMVLLFVIGASWLAAHGITKPLRELERGVAEIGTGNLDFRIETVSVDEVGKLSRSINEMAGRLKEITASRDMLNAEIGERRAAEEKFRVIYSCVPCGLVMLDAEEKVAMVNPEAERLLGYSDFELVGGAIAPFLGADEQPLLAAIFEGRRGITRVAGRIRTKAEKPLLARITFSPVWNDAGNVVYCIMLVEDITEETRRENQLRQSQRLEAIGQLAGGVAHDFNNQLTVIQVYLDKILRSMPQDSSERDRLLKIQKVVDRSATLPKQLLLFSRQVPMQKETFDLNHQVIEVLELLEKLLGERITVSLRLADDLLPLAADRGNMSQVVTNLVLNARDAMPLGGKITVSTTNEVVGEDYRRQHPYARCGSFVRFSVQDEGTGVREDVGEKIFDPFFTTKPEGKGSGLGLSVVKGIVDSHGGWITFESEKGFGARFDVFLPVATGEERAAPREALAPYGRVSPRGERILFVEDEAPLREAVTECLLEDGFRVSACGSIAEARRIFASEAGRFDIVLSDVMLPDGNGAEFVMEAKKIRGDMKALLISGYAADINLDGDTWSDGTPFLAKPFKIGVLMRRIREVLGPTGAEVAK